MEINTALFYIFSGVLLFAAFRVITARSPVYAALYLVLAFFNAACVWMLLRSEFLAIALVLVYVGAVMVLFLFVVMMLDMGVDTLRQGFWNHFPVAALVGVIIALEMAAVLLPGFNLHDAPVVSLPMNSRGLTTTVKAHPNGAADVPFDALWQQLRDAFVSLTAGVAEAKALRARRQAGGRELTGRHLEQLSRTLEAAEATLTELRSLAQAPPAGPPQAKAAAADGVRLRLELARRRLQRAGVLERPA